MRVVHINANVGLILVGEAVVEPYASSVFAHFRDARRDVVVDQRVRGLVPVGYWAMIGASAGEAVSTCWRNRALGVVPEPVMPIRWREPS